MSEAPQARRAIRSFVLREGRMTDGQKAALARLWPRYGIDAPAVPLDFASIFGRSAPVTFEIGFGNGDHLLSRAQNEPARDFIGAEVHRPGVGRMLHHAESADLSNLRAINHDAVVALRDWIADGTLDEVVIYFPDPWHKTRHHKRRLIQPEFVALLARKLAIGGRIHLATDWENYAEHMLAVLNAAPGFVNAAVDGRYIPRRETRPKTRFEARGERLGHAVFDLEFRRTATP